MILTRVFPNTLISYAGFGPFPRGTLLRSLDVYGWTASVGDPCMVTLRLADRLVRNAAGSDDEFDALQQNVVGTSRGGEGGGFVGVASFGQQIDGLVLAASAAPGSQGFAHAKVHLNILVGRLFNCFMVRSEPSAGWSMWCSLDAVPGGRLGGWSLELDEMGRLGR